MSLEPITVGELLPEATLADCERLFREGERQEKFGQLKQAVALRAIRDESLFSPSHDSFKSYVEDHLGYTEQWAYGRIALAQVAGELNHGLATPAIINERQARAIKPVLRDHGPEVATEVLREAADDDGKLTARSISEAATRVIEPEIVEAEVIDDERPVLTSQQWMAREGYADELAPRRRTEAEREALRAKSKSDAIRQRNLDVNVGFSVISELKHPHILDEVLDNWQPLSTDWTAPMIHDLADLLHQIADRWKATA